MATAKGTEQLGVGIDSALAKDLREFAERRGEKIRAVVEQALRRHMAYPPAPPQPVVPPPLPPITPLPDSPATSEGVVSGEAKELKTTAKKKGKK